MPLREGVAALARATVRRASSSEPEEWLWPLGVIATQGATVRLRSSTVREGEPRAPGAAKRGRPPRGRDRRGVARARAPLRRAAPRTLRATGRLAAKEAREVARHIGRGQE